MVIGRLAGDSMEKAAIAANMTNNKRLLDDNRASVWSFSRSARRVSSIRIGKYVKNRGLQLILVGYRNIPAMANQTGVFYTRVP